MAGSIRESRDGTAPALTSTIEPSTKKGSAGDTAFNDAVALVAFSWLFLIFLMWSLRHHDV